MSCKYFTHILRLHYLWIICLFSSHKKRCSCSRTPVKFYQRSDRMDAVLLYFTDVSLIRTIILSALWPHNVIIALCMSYSIRHKLDRILYVFIVWHIVYRSGKTHTTINIIIDTDPVLVTRCSKILAIQWYITSLYRFQHV